MSDTSEIQILATKLYIPLPRPQAVLRPRLIEQLNAGLRQNQGLGHNPGFGRKLTLISAPAGFGKTTLVSEWVSERMRDEGGRSASFILPPSSLMDASGPWRLHPSQVAWLSLDEGDNDPTRFLAYLVAAVQTIVPNVGKRVSVVLESPQPPPIESILTVLLNEITTLPDDFILVLDDYHAIDSKAVDHALTFLIEHLPSQMHLVIATREDPQLPLSRLRVQGQLTELRATDLRFTPSEAATFFNQAMGLNLSAEDVAALETRTEGWIAGLQLAAISLHGQEDATGFIRSFTGSNRFVMDYLVEQVLQQQSESVQMFLLRTSILDRLCGPLCDAVLGKEEGRRRKVEKQTNAESSSFLSSDPWSEDRGLAPSSLTLENLERANLFIVPLDDERRWYRYHHLFADLLRQRLQQSSASPVGEAGSYVAELNIRASQWYEDNGLVLEAFHHAVAANDIERAARLVEGKEMPRHFRGAVTAILDWLASLPRPVLNARPSLWWRYASLLLIVGRTTDAEEKLQAAEAALQGAELDDNTRNLIGQIATARAALVVAHYQVEPMLVLSRRALEYLNPNSLSSRATANWTLGFAYFNQGDRAAAREALTRAVSLGQASGDIFTTILATIGLGQIQELENQLYLAAQTYRRVLQLAGDQPLQVLCEAQLGLARILYEWNDLDAAELHGQQSLQLARQFDRVIDRFIISEVFLARMKLARGDVAGAEVMLTQADQSARQQNFVHRIPEVAAAQVLILLRQGNLAAAAQLAQTHKLPISQARVLLSLGDPAAALGVLEPLRQQMEVKGWQDERLKAMVLQAVALQARGAKGPAVQLLGDALALAEPGGFIRLFVDEGEPMAELLGRMKDEWLRPLDEGRNQNGGRTKYVGTLLDAFKKAGINSSLGLHPSTFIPPPLVEPLSKRELEILQLVAQGLSNREIGARLFLALSTVKGHNRVIFDKLQVENRTEAVARARALGLL